jgi:hypothetical protein
MRRRSQSRTDSRDRVGVPLDFGIRSIQSPLVPTVLRGNAVFDALRRLRARPRRWQRTRSVRDGIPTEDRGNDGTGRLTVQSDLPSEPATVVGTWPREDDRLAIASPLSVCLGVEGLGTFALLSKRNNKD